jgi:antitoxin component YwqK of YwqJK toxin-antitoxin module
MKNVLILVLFFVQVSFAQVNQVDAKGLKQGPWHKNYPGTNVHMYEGNFKDDKPVGTFIYKYQSGKVKAVIDNKPNSNLSAVKLYFENEALMADGFYRNQKKDSVWMNYSERGELVSAESYKNDKLNGKKVNYYLNDQLEAGSLNVLSVTFFVDDIREGAFKEFYPNGKMKISGTYVKGLRTGEWVEYYNTGQTMSRVRYKADYLHGWSYYYDKNGTQLSKNLWRKGEKIEGKELETYLKWCQDKNIDPNL